MVRMYELPADGQMYRNENNKKHGLDNAFKQIKKALFTGSVSYQANFMTEYGTLYTPMSVN